MDLPQCETKSRKKICALTMVRNDDFFLERWVDYYGAQFGRENLYVFMDGKDQQVPEFCKDVNVTIMDKFICRSVIQFDKQRLAYLSDRAHVLFETYDIVIGTDADEFLIIDPELNVSLSEYLSEVKYETSVSGLGIDVGQHLEREGEIDPLAPLIGQRRFGYLSTRYTKPSTLFQPARWGSGFHRVKYRNYRIDNNLFLFHFGSVDYKMLEQRGITNGWSSRHMYNRARTIHKVSKLCAREWSETTAFARRVQTYCRLLHAPNKPSMAGMSLIVEIPKRFNGIV